MGTINVYVRPHENWAGDKYFLFSTHENGTLAEVDVHKEGFFRIFGYQTGYPSGGYDVRKTKNGAFAVAKRQCREFLNAIGDRREVVFV